MTNYLAHMPPNFGETEGYPENLDAPRFFNYLFLRIHEGRYTCLKYLAYIVISHTCDDWQNRPGPLDLDRLEMRKEDLKRVGRHWVIDLQKQEPRDV